MCNIFKKYGIQETAASCFSTRYPVGDWFERCLYILDEKGIIKNDSIKDIESNALIFICLGILWYESEDLRDQDHLIVMDYCQLIETFSNYEIPEIRKRITIFDKIDSESEIIDKANEKRKIIYHALYEYFSPADELIPIEPHRRTINALKDLFFGNESAIETLNEYYKYSKQIEDNIHNEISYVLQDALDKHYDDCHNINEIKRDYNNHFKSLSLDIWLDNGFSI
jgi:hypothetical protein